MIGRPSDAESFKAIRTRGSAEIRVESFADIRMEALTELGAEYRCGRDCWCRYGPFSRPAGTRLISSVLEPRTSSWATFTVRLRRTKLNRNLLPASYGRFSHLTPDFFIIRQTSGTGRPTTLK